MSSLYVQQQGAVIRRAGKRLIVRRGEETLQAMRMRDLERVALFGSVELSAPAAIALMEAGIETVFLSLGGRFRGRLAPAEGKNVFLRQAQFRAYDDANLRLRTARALLNGKICNSRRLLQRHHQKHPSASLEQAAAELEKRREQLQQPSSLDGLLGVEGAAAHAYFAAFGGMVRSEFAFTVRSRRPPRDAVNALLSFGYTLLATELTGAVAAEGLDPAVGLLHHLDYGRPSLALDLLEEFRQPVVDRLVLSLINRRVLRQEHFEDRGQGGVLLNDAGRRRFLEFYYRTLETPFSENGQQRMTYREIFQRQARGLRAVIENQASYTPYLLPTGGARAPALPVEGE